MTTAGPIRTLLGLALTALLGSGCAPVTTVGSERLHVEHRGWIFSGSDLELDLTGRGALSQRSVSIVVAVNGHTVGSWNTAAGKARIRIDSGQLRPGVNRITLKTGSERARLAIRVLPIGPALAAAVAGSSLVLLAWGIRRRRRPPG